MRIADASEISELADRTGGWALSVFLPPHRVADNVGADALLLKNMLGEAEAELVVLGMRPPDAADMVAGAVPGELFDPGAEAFHKGGVAIFAAARWRAAYRLTCEMPELWVVSPRLHLKPLLQEVAADHRFFVLAVTRGFARLYRGSRDDLVAVRVPDMPADLDEAIKYDDRERALLSHSASRRGVGGVVAAFHGQGDRADHFPEDVMRYLRLVDAAVTKVVGASTPVVLSGSLDLVGLYRSLSSLPLLSDADVVGNPELMPADELHRRAQAIVDAASEEPVAAMQAEFERRHGTGGASDDPSVVVAAAEVGRVGSLLVGAGTQCWGRPGDPGSPPEIHEVRGPGDEDLLDRAAVRAWRTGADVRVVPSASLPASGVAAVFRY